MGLRRRVSAEPPDPEPAPVVPGDPSAVPPSIASGAFDGIPVSELGAGPADHWVANMPGDGAPLGSPAVTPAAPPMQDWSAQPWDGSSDLDPAAIVTPPGAVTPPPAPTAMPAPTGPPPNHPLTPPALPAPTLPAPTLPAPALTQPSFGTAAAAPNPGAALVPTTTPAPPTSAAPGSLAALGAGPGSPKAPSAALGDALDGLDDLLGFTGEGTSTADTEDTSGFDQGSPAAHGGPLDPTAVESPAVDAAPSISSIVDQLLDSDAGSSEPGQDPAASRFPLPHQPGSGADAFENPSDEGGAEEGHGFEGHAEEDHAEEDLLDSFDADDDLAALFDDEDTAEEDGAAEDGEATNSDGGGWEDAASPASKPEPPRERARATMTRYQPPVARTIDYTRAGGLIDQITSGIATRPNLAKKVSEFRLTRDEALDARQRSELEHIVTRELTEVNIAVTARELPEILDVVYDELIGLGPIGVVWRDPAVTEICIDGWDKIYVEVGGKLLTTDYRFRSKDHAESTARGLAEKVSGRAVSPTNPLVTAELPGARVNIVFRPIARTGLNITLRKLSGVMGMGDLLKRGSVSQEMADFLHDAVRSRAAVLVSGGTGAGKTTLLNALSESIGIGERVITIEDSYELTLASPFVVSMQTKEAASGDDRVIIGQDQLLRNSLRMRPDRIIVGEMRDPDAAQVMLSAANTGHEGTMTTIHADSADLAVNLRLANLVRSATSNPVDVVRWEIATAFDLVVQATRNSFTGARFISEIAEVTTDGLDSGERISVRPLFRGTALPEGGARFDRVAALSDGELSHRIAATGLDAERWTRIS